MLRDALKLLEDRGLVLAERGRGNRIAQLGAAITDPLIALLAQSPEVADDGLEFRDVVESQAALAAIRANDIDRRMIAECLSAIEIAHDGADPEEEAEADAALHLAIYEASHNLVLLQIMQALAGILRSDVIQNRSRMFTIPATRELLRDQHRDCAGDPEPRCRGRAGRRACASGLYRQASREIREAEAKLGQSLRRLSGGGFQARRAGPLPCPTPRCPAQASTLPSIAGCHVLFRHEQHRSQPRHIRDHVTFRADSAARSRTANCPGPGDGGLSRPYRGGEPAGECLISMCPQWLLAEAAQADAELAGQARGWLHGIPQAPKDLTATRDMEAPGHRGLRDFLPPGDSAIEARWRRGRHPDRQDQHAGILRSPPTTACSAPR